MITFIQQSNIPELEKIQEQIRDQIDESLPGNPPIPQNFKPFPCPTPLIFSIMWDAIDSMKYLIQIGADVTKQYKGWSPIHFAVLSKNISMIHLILSEAKEELEATTLDTKSTPLHIATSNNALDVVAYLLHRGANVNAVNDVLISPLHLSMSLNSPECAKYLLAFGANPCLEDNQGRKPRFFAKTNTHFDKTTLEQVLQDLKDQNHLPSRDEILSSYLFPLDDVTTY